MTVNLANACDGRKRIFFFYPRKYGQNDRNRDARRAQYKDVPPKVNTPRTATAANPNKAVQSLTRRSFARGVRDGNNEGPGRTITINCLFPGRRVFSYTKSGDVSLRQATRRARLGINRGRDGRTSFQGEVFESRTDRKPYDYYCRTRGQIQ